MSTINKAYADIIKSQDGYYADDPRVLRITEYENAFNGALAYGVEYRKPFGRYAASEFVINPRIYWEAK